MANHRAVCGISWLCALAACSGGKPTLADAGPGSAIAPIAGLDSNELQLFDAGSQLFQHSYTAREGLGPLYTKASCSGCHAIASQGPGSAAKMAVVDDAGVPDPDQSFLPYGNTEHPLVAGGGMTPVLPPSGSPPSGYRLLLTKRNGPALLGRGYIEAIEESEIERVQAGEPAAVQGRINRVTYHSVANSVTSDSGYQLGQTGLVGRFGVKARSATVDDFISDALQGDMGLTSPLRPNEIPNPDHLLDDDLPGVDLELSSIAALAGYIRGIAIPARPTAPSQGEMLFTSLGCADCHTPSMHTRADYPIAALADIDAPIYSDLLLHQMGPSTSDGIVDESALATEWRTAPLIGIALQQSYLHDGRAATLAEALLFHALDGSQAQPSAQAFQALALADQDALLGFLNGL